MMDTQSKDFIFSFVLIALGIFVLISGIAIFNDAALPPYSVTEFSLSPGFMPVVLGAALLLCSILLFFQSLKGKGSFKAAVCENSRQFANWIKPAFKSQDTIYMAVGILFMFIYSYFLVGWLPYWAASLIFLVALMLFLRAAKWWKVIIISLAAVGLIVLLFQVCFNAALPS
ncbi:MAG: tripartite tricarboxylate transporter TctB family protein [Sphaerochaetaceae bacterium]|jgi:hypothetical protein|nr:tripartite tricarboxylate transporter TctB family protein [Sphaerochaetaceae bacterium]